MLFIILNFIIQSLQCFDKYWKKIFNEQRIPYLPHSYRFFFSCHISIYKSSIKMKMLQETSWASLTNIFVSSQMRNGSYKNGSIKNLSSTFALLPAATPDRIREYSVCRTHTQAATTSLRIPLVGFYTTYTQTTYTLLSQQEHKRPSKE